MADPIVTPDPAAPPSVSPATAAPEDNTQLPLNTDAAKTSVTPMKAPVVAPAASAPPANHGILGDIFQDLAGGKKTVWTQTPNGPVASKVNLKPGEMAQGILSAALVGLASGYAPEARGKGPGGAFSAGFTGESELKDAQAKNARDAAQKQFQNQQTTDELTLRKQQNAREQQRSIEEAQEHAARMKQMQQTLEQGKIQGAEHVIDFQQKQADRVNLLAQAGVKPLAYPTGQMVEEFNSPDEAMDWANKNSKLAIQPGKYNTIVEVDPHTNRYMIMQKPVSWDDPQWLGVKTKDGVPERDKDGNMIPDGSFKDLQGKPVAPAGQISQHQLYDSQARLLELQTKELTTQEAVERLKIAKTAREKDTQQMVADEQFNRAQGNPDAIDEKTHEFIVSPSSRTILQQRFIKDGAMQATILNAAEKEMDRIGAPGPNATEEDKQAYAGLAQQAEEARLGLHQVQVNLMMLSRTPNIADTISNNIRKQYTKPDGTYDEQGAVQSLDKMQMASGVKQTARQKLMAQTPSLLANPDTFARVLGHAQQMITSGQSPEAVIGEINRTVGFSQEDKQKLIDAINKPPKTPAEEAVEPGTEGTPAQAIGSVISSLKENGTGKEESPEPVAAQ
jgi:hypothetical protein